LQNKRIWRGELARSIGTGADILAEVGLKHLLKRRPTIVPQPSISGVNNAQPLSPMKALVLLSKLQSADIVLPTTDGREIRLRRVAERTPEQESLNRSLIRSV